jgi:MFS family permease
MVPEPDGEGRFRNWSVVIAAFSILFVAAGPRLTFGNFIKPLTEHFGWTIGTVSIAAALNTLFFGLALPIAGWMVDRFGPRKVLLITLPTYGLATTSLAFLGNIWQLYLIHGVLVGMSFGASSLIAVPTLVAQWFRKRRGVTLGVSFIGLATGQLVLVPLSMAIILNIGWRFAYVFLGLLLLGIGVPMAWRFAKNKPPTPDAVAEDTVSAAKGNQVRIGSKAPSSWFAGLRKYFGRKTFWLIAASYFVCGSTVNLISVYYVPLAGHLGLGEKVGAAALGLIGGASIAGVYISSFFSDKIGRKNPMALLYLLRAIGVLLLLFTRSERMLYTSSILIGLSFLATAPLVTALMADIYGPATMATALGLVNLVHQLGGTMSIYLAGIVIDTTGSYHWPIVASVLLLLLASVASFVVTEKPMPTWAAETAEGVLTSNR